MFRWLRKKRVYIFGASNGGAYVYSQLKRRTVLGFIDNDKDKWGGELVGLAITSPSVLKTADFDEVLIASTYANEIEEQLENMGIGNVRIVPCVPQSAYHFRVFDYLLWLLAKKSFVRILCSMEAEAGEISKRLKSSKLMVGGFPPQIDIEDIHCLPADADTVLRIMVQHCGAVGLKHREALDRLQKYRNENIAISCPMSYGQQNHIAYIKKHGSEHFGDKFEVRQEHSGIKEYVNEYLCNIDIAVFNIENNTGLSTQWLLLYLGKKLYTSGICYRQFKAMGLDVFHYREFGGETFSEFRNFEGGKRNRQIMSKIFDQTYYVKNWRDVFRKAKGSAILHVMPTSIFAQGMTRFFAGSFEELQHRYIFLNGVFVTKTEEPFEGEVLYEELFLNQRKLVVEDRKLLLKRMQEADLIVLYAFNLSCIRNMLLKHPLLFRKTMWHVWGSGDGMAHRLF